MADIMCTAPQRHFLNSVLRDDTVDTICYGGARGGGKTFVSASGMTLRRIEYPKTRGLMLRRTQSASDQNLKAEIDKVIDMLGIPYRAVKYKVNDRLFEFPNRSTIKLGYCKLDSDYQQYMGTEYTDICFEEGTQHPKTAWDLVGGSNRSNVRNCRPKRWMTANPGGIGHTWVLRDFIDPLSRLDGVLYIPSLIANNYAQLENDPGYTRRVLDVLPDWQRRQWRDGDWNAIAGAYFSMPSEMIRPTFDPSRSDNPENAIQIPYHAVWYGGVDFGSSAPFAVQWVAKWKDSNGKNHAHVVKELYRANLHLDEQAEHVNEIEELLREKSLLNAERVIYYGDPAIKKKIESVSTEAGATIRSTWALHKFYVLPAHTNARVPGWELMRYLIHRGILTVDPSCRALISEMRGAIYEGTKAGGAPTGEDIEQGSEVSDHQLDSLRYCLASTFRIGFSERDIDPYALRLVSTEDEELAA